MKKLLIGAAVAAAAFGVKAELASANVVGFTEVLVTKFSTHVGTLTSLTASEAAMTFGEIKTNSKSDGAGNYVSGWNPDGDYIYFVDQTGKMSTPYYNVPDWQAKETEDWEGYEAGWYLLGDEDYVCRNSSQLCAFGDGFVVLSYTDDAGKSWAVGNKAQATIVESLGVAQNAVVDQLNTIWGGGSDAVAFSGSGSTIGGYAAVPEPTSGLLMLVGLGALALRRRRA